MISFVGSLFFFYVVYAIFTFEEEDGLSFDLIEIIRGQLSNYEIRPLIQDSFSLSFNRVYFDFYAFNESKKNYYLSLVNKLV
jgi:hypothetical protein